MDASGNDMAAYYSSSGSKIQCIPHFRQTSRSLCGPHDFRDVCFSHQYLQCQLLCGRSNASLGVNQLLVESSRVIPSFPQDPGTHVAARVLTMLAILIHTQVSPGYQVKVLHKPMCDTLCMCCSAVCLDKSPGESCSKLDR